MKKHRVLMLLCCLIPVALLLAIFVFKVPANALITFAIFLLCPALHLLMMRKGGHGHGQAGCGHDETTPESQQSMEVPNELTSGETEAVATASLKIDERATALTRARYDRLAYFYDFLEGFAERRFRHWRLRLWEMVEGSQVLEVGVGTGKNIPYWPKDAQITGIDLTPGMLEIARARAGNLGREASLQLEDIQNIEFPDGSFDAAVATFVFCSVPNPVLGLSELGRVVRPGGQVLLLEHIRPEHPLLGWFMDLVNPLVVRMMGANINRRTLENVKAAGLQLESVQDLGKAGIFKLIVARTAPYPSHRQIEEGSPASAVN